MLEKKYLLLKFLMDKNSCVSSSEIQEFLGVSRRSVINYVKELNYDFEYVIASSREGYSLIDSIRIQKYLSEISDLDFDYDKRKREIVYKTLITNQAISMEQIMDSDYISESTFNSDILKLKKEVSNYNLQIKIKRGIISIVGDENDKRKYVLSLLNEDIENKSYGLDDFQIYFKHINFDDLKTIVRSVLDINDAFIDEYSLQNYVLHLTILIEVSLQQKESSNYYQGITRSETLYGKKVIEITKQIHRKLFDIGVSVDFAALLNVSILMSTRAITKDFEKITYESLNGVISKEALDIIDLIVLNVHKYYSLDLRDDGFKVRFAFHISNLITRLRNNVKLPKGQFSGIGDDYKFLYFLAKYIGSIISEQANVEINNTELSYIAIHLAMLIDEKRNSKKQVNCAIVIYDYYNLGKILFNKIKQEISSLYLVDIVSDFNDLNLDNIDLLISTMNVPFSISVPTMKIGCLPTDADIQKIKNMVESIADKNKKQEIENSIRKFVRSDLFFFDVGLKTKDEVFEKINKLLLEKKFVNEKFYDKLVERENIVSTAIDDLAIPHSMNTEEECVLRSCISVILSKEPISWGTTSVNYVFLVALKNEDRSFFKDVIGIITSAITDNKTKKELLSCNEYDSFIQLFVNKAS